jgi:hypothetical protein
MCTGPRTQLASGAVDPLLVAGASKPVLYAFVPAWLGVYGDFPSHNAKGQRNMVAVGYDKSIAIDFRALKPDDIVAKPLAGAAFARAQASVLGHGTADRK